MNKDGRLAGAVARAPRASVVIELTYCEMNSGFEACMKCSSLCYTSELNYVFVASSIVIAK